MTFVARKIDLVLTYGTGEDGLGTPETVQLSGHRVSAHCEIAGGVGLGAVTVRVYGLTLSLMNKLSTLGQLPSFLEPNTITILAGDETIGMSQVFRGTIIAAWADMMGAPDIAFNIQASVGAYEAVQAIPPSSFPGTADAAVILGNLAAQMGVRFENNGVSVILSKPYFPGAARAQAEAVVHAAGIEWNGLENGVLAIWPQGGSRGGRTLKLSAKSGLVGYPAYTATGIMVTSEFLPTVRFGDLVQVESILTPANGTWKVVTLVHDLEALTPNGKWFTQMQLAVPSYVVAP